MKLIKVQSIEEFKDQLKENDTIELAEAMLEAIQRGIKKNSKKVAVCDVEVEEDGGYLDYTHLRKIGLWL